MKLQTTNHIFDPTVWPNCIHLNRMKTFKQLEQLLVPSGTSCLNYPCLRPLFLSPPPELPDPEPEHGKSQPQTAACPGRNANTRRTEARLAPESPRKENNHKIQMPPSGDKKKEKKHKVDRSKQFVKDDGGESWRGGDGGRPLMILAWDRQAAWRGLISAAGAHRDMKLSYLTCPTYSAQSGACRSQNWQCSFQTRLAHSSENRRCLSVRGSMISLFENVLILFNFSIHTNTIQSQTPFSFYNSRVKSSQILKFSVNRLF